MDERELEAYRQAVEATSHHLALRPNQEPGIWTRIFLLWALFLSACASSSANPQEILASPPPPARATLPPSTPFPSFTPPPSPVILPESPPASPIPPPTETKTAAELHPVLRELLNPLIDQSAKRRQERFKEEGELGQTIDQEINQQTINILLAGFGKTHEPPLTEKGTIGSQTIISLNYNTGDIRIFSITHDTRAPQVEKAAHYFGPDKKGSAKRIDEAYPIGGFSLQRRVFEAATGMYVDYQIVFQDSILQRAIDEIFGGVVVSLPGPIDIQPTWVGGKKVPATRFPEGSRIYSGAEILSLIKGVPVAEGHYPPWQEHNRRKEYVLEGITKALNRQWENPAFWVKVFAFATKETATSLLSKDIEFDFDIVSLFIANLGNMINVGGRVFTTRDRTGVILPHVVRSIYVVDPAHGDGGVQWVTANYSRSTRTAADFNNGVYPGPDFEIPYSDDLEGVDPYGDPFLYWQSVRDAVRQKLFELPPKN